MAKRRWSSCQVCRGNEKSVGKYNINMLQMRSGVIRLPVQHGFCVLCTKGIRGLLGASMPLSRKEVAAPEYVTLDWVGDPSCLFSSYVVGARYADEVRRSA